VAVIVSGSELHFPRQMIAPASFFCRRYLLGCYPGALGVEGNEPFSQVRFFRKFDTGSVQKPERVRARVEDNDVANEGPLRPDWRRACL
jgi:hypothetical protein